MSTIGILPTTPTPFPSTAAPDPGEFLDLSFPFPDEDPLGLTTLSSNTNTFSWNGEPNRSPPGLHAESNWADQRPDQRPTSQWPAYAPGGQGFSSNQHHYWG